MHELSIAEAILDVITEHARGRRVTAVEVEVGHLRQAVPSALSFAFELAAAGTVAEGAELILREVPVRARCCRCDTLDTQERFPCGAPPAARSSFRSSQVRSCQSSHSR